LSIGLGSKRNDDDADEINVGGSSAESARPTQSPSWRPTLRPSSAPSTHWSTLKWTQRGEDFTGDVPRDEFGKSVSLSADGTVMAVGAPAHNGNGPKSGQVKIYLWDEEGDSSSDYVEIQSLYGDESDRGYLGISVSISADGKTLAVGANGSDVNGSFSGQVNVYSWDDAASNFYLLQSIHGDDADDQLGFSLSLSADGKTLAVGAPRVEAAGPGYVKVYSWDDASSNFVQRKDGRINGDDEYDYFGRAVKLSGDGTIMAVGAPRNDANGEGSGQVKVYVLDDATLSYKELQALYGKSKGYAFGFNLSVSSDGKFLAVAAPGNEENSGLVTVYEWDKDASSNTYRELQTMCSNVNADEFGSLDPREIGRYSLSFSADGTTLAVGSAWSNGNSGDSGQVNVFVLNGASSEYERIGDTFYGEGIDLLGYSVSLSEGGKILAIGATQRFDNDKSGTVKVFAVEYE